MTDSTFRVRNLRVIEDEIEFDLRDVSPPPPPPPPGELAFATLSFENNDVPTPISARSDDFSVFGVVQIFNLDAARGMSLDPSTGEIEVLQEGLYHLSVSLQLMGTPRNILSFAVFSGDVQITARASRKMGSAGDDVGSAGTVGMAHLMPGDKISVRVQNEISDEDALARHGSFAIFQVSSQCLIF